MRGSDWSASAPASSIKSRAFLLERGIAVRQGQRFLRAELPRILATPPDATCRPHAWLRLIRDLAGDWRRLDERVESLSGEIEAVARQDVDCERLMSVAGDRPDHPPVLIVAAIGRGDAVREGTRLLAPGSFLVPATDIDRRPHDPGQDIEARQSLPACPVRAGRLGRAESSRKSWERQGLKPWIEAAKKRPASPTMLAIALANKLARIASGVLAHGRNFEARTNTNATAQAADRPTRDEHRKMRSPRWKRSTINTDLPAEVCEKMG